MIKSEVDDSTTTQDEHNANRWAKKTWNHVGMFTREEAANLLGERLVGQKRRVLMKDCIRMTYYCHVQRSSGCRYEMSVWVPKDRSQKLRVDDINQHTCDLELSRQKRRTRPHVEDFDRPIEKRKRKRGSRNRESPGGEQEDVYNLGETMASFLQGLDQNNTETDVDTDKYVSEGSSTSLPNNNFNNNLNNINNNVNNINSINNSSHINNNNICNQPTNTNILANLLSQPTTTHHPQVTYNDRVWQHISIDVIDMNPRIDGQFSYVFHAIDKVSRYAYASAMASNQPEVVVDSLFTMLFTFGRPDVICIESFYRDSILPIRLADKFPEIVLSYYTENHNAHGMIIPRRENQLMRERILAWMMEKDTRGWASNLSEIKYNHNSEWIEDLGDSPMELFFDRKRSRQMFT